MRKTEKAGRRCMMTLGSDRFLRAAGMLLCAGMLLSSCGGGGDGPTPPTQTAEELTESGWEKFESGNLTGARSDFTSAISKDSDYGPAYVGQGWARLGLATSSSAHGEAVTSFDGAVQRQETGPEVYAGRAAAQLGSGGAGVSLAITDAQAARNASPTFVFAHRQTFTFADLHLIEAYALAAQANWTGALASADQILGSGIVGGNPATWVVDGTTYSTFESAVLAFLQKLSVEVAG